MISLRNLSQCSTNAGACILLASPSACAFLCCVVLWLSLLSSGRGLTRVLTASLSVVPCLQRHQRDSELALRRDAAGWYAQARSVGLARWGAL